MASFDSVGSTSLQERRDELRARAVAAMLRARSRAGSAAPTWVLLDLEGTVLPLYLQAARDDMVVRMVVPVKAGGQWEPGNLALVRTVRK